MVDLIPSSESVMHILQNTGAYRKGHFIYPNGKHASHYFQMPLAFRYYDNARILSVGLSRMFRMEKSISSRLPKVSVISPSPGGIMVAFGVREALGAEHSAHNAYVSVVVELGFIGLILFVALLAVSLQHARLAPPAERKVLIILWLTLFVGLTPRAWEAKKATWVIFGFLNASAVAGAAAPAPLTPVARLPVRPSRRRPPVSGAA